MILPIRTPVWKFAGGESLGLHTVPLGDLVLVKRKLYIYDNDTGLSSTTTINQAVSNKNLIEITASAPTTPDVPVKTTLQAPTLTISPSVLNVGETTTITVTDIDENTALLTWNISGVTFEEPAGILVGNDTAKIDSLTLRVTSHGTLVASCFAKPKSGSMEFSESASSNAVTAIVSKVVSGGNGDPEDDYDTYINATTDKDGKEGIVVNPVKTGGVHVYFNALPYKSPGSPATTYISMGGSQAVEDIFKITAVEEYLHKPLLVKRVRDGKYFTGVICEAENTSKTACLFTELAVN